MTPEAKVKVRVKALLKKRHVYSFMPVQQGFGSQGLDFHCSHRGMAFFIETKAPGNTLTARQELTRADMIASGAIVFVIGERHQVKNDKYIYSGEAALDAWLLRPNC